MRRILASLALALSLSAPGAVLAQETPQAPPRLVVAISVDQFSADLFAEYRQHFTQGLGRLLQGAVFPSGYQSHAATETCPGHSTILTGVHPSRSGIVANNWYDTTLKRADKRVYCAEDETDKRSTSGDPVVSARHLKVPTLGDRLKSASKQSRNVAVSAKDRSVVMMGGHDIDQAYWWKDGGFATLPKRKLDRAAVDASKAAAFTIEQGAADLAVPDWCSGKDRAVMIGETSVGTGRFAVRPGKEADFRVSPRIDQATLGLALRLTEDMKLGKRKATDVLSVSLSATDYIGHTKGTEGVEMCIQMAELDRTLGEFFGRLDAQNLDYVVVLTADHGGLDVAERLEQQGFPAKRIDDTLDTKALAWAITSQTGVAAPAGGELLYSDGPSGDYYVNKALAAEDRAKVADALVALAKSNPQVEAVFTAQQIAAIAVPVGGPQDWTLEQRVRASFDAERSGDVIILLKRGIVPIGKPEPGKSVATHGSVWDYDRRVPILFWRKELPGFEQPAPIETVDIAPTLAAVIGLPVAAGEFDGRCLDIDGSARDLCRGIAAK